MAQQKDNSGKPVAKDRLMSAGQYEMNQQEAKRFAEVKKSSALKSKNVMSNENLRRQLNTSTSQNGTQAGHAVTSVDRKTGKAK